MAALAAAGTLLVATIAAKFAFGQLKEAQRLRNEQAQPYVFVALEPNEASRKLIDLVIKNVGNTAAKNITFAFDPSPLRSTQYDPASTGKNLGDFIVFKDGIKYLPPRGEFRLLFEYVPELDRKKGSHPLKYEVTVAYEDSQGDRCATTSYVLDLEPNWDLLQANLNTIDDVVNGLKAIHNDLQVMASTLDRHGAA